MSLDQLKLVDFPLQTFDKVRYGDTDRQGHVNNTAFVAFLKTGRVEILFNPEYPLLSPTTSFLIASLHLDFLQEIYRPGRADIDTGIQKIGSSSITFCQKQFQGGRCVAKAKTVVVHIDENIKRGVPLTDEARKELSCWVLNQDPQ